jgi:Fe2+ or Zn2+ uptake regulation protein
MKAAVLALALVASSPAHAGDPTLIYFTIETDHFVACHHPNSDQHSVPFLICDRCHSAVELEDREVVTQLENRAKALGFQPQAQTLEVHGLCARCAA